MEDRSVRSAAMAILTVALGGAAVAAPARAADAVTYEIVSDSIPAVDIEYMHAGGRALITAVPLPWRMDVQLDNAQGPTGTGAQLRADWRRIRGPATWVTIRILSGGRVLCQSTLDVGNVSCYGNTPHSA